MSYTKHYHEIIRGTAQKSVTVNGESHVVTVSYSEPVDIAIHVDTSPFDHNVNGCCTAVNRLTGAVVATEAAEIATKKQTSRQIGDALMKGFFTYIHTDLSQQIKELLSKTESLLIELVEQNKECVRRKDVMADDYHRITKRYSALFADLDKELASRIHSISAPAFTFTEHSVQALQRPVDTDLLGVSSIVANETSHLDCALKCSSIKKRAQNLIDNANSYLEGTYKLQHSLHAMLFSDCNLGLKYIPIAYVESVVSLQGVDRQLYGANCAILRNSKGIEVKLKTHFQDKQLQWNDMDATARRKIDSYFDEELQHSDVTQRVAKTMLMLKKNSQIKAIKNELL